MTNALRTRMLLATDGSDDAAAAARVAVELSNKLGLLLDVVYVGEAPMVYRPEYKGYHTLLENLRAEARQRLEEQVEWISAAGGSVGTAHLRLGRPDAEIVALAEEIGADPVVVGSRGLGPLKRTLVGSVSESVVHHAHASVLVVRPPREEGGTGHIPEGKVLVAVDGSEEAALAARRAGVLAGGLGAKLHVLSVGEYDVSSYYTNTVEEGRRQAREVLDKQVRGIEEEEGAVVAETHVRVGRPAAEIVAAAEDIGAGLIVVGSHGLGGIKRALMGSVSDAVVRHADCPVMVVRPRSRS